MYIRFILEKTPLILTQIDRDKDSPTYGDCDRNHWHLKIRDFSSAILQQSGLLLAKLYEYDFPGNIYYNNINIKDWAIATVNYWCKIQLKDGSFNEYYPNEHGFPPTAFTLYTICETYKILNIDDEKVKKKIRKTALYLGRTLESKALNQEMASITSLYNAYLILKDDEIKKYCENKLLRLLSMQDDEGWFIEQGGADIGYLSVSFDMLAEYYRLSKDPRVISPLEKLLNFIMYFIHPDNTIGGEYGSRNTTYFLPNGLQVMANLGYKNAEDILQRLFNDEYSHEYFLNSVDDRYLTHYIMHSFIRALTIRKEIKYDKILQYETEKYFPNAGFYVYRNNDIYIVIGLKKGGVIKIFKHNKEIYNDCGYRVKKGKKVIVTNWQDNSYKITYKEKKISIEGFMNKVGTKNSSTLVHIGLRIFSLILGKKLNTLLKLLLIYAKKRSNIYFTRNIEIENDRVIIDDYIKSIDKIQLEKASNMSMRLVASGKFFMNSDLLYNKYTYIKNNEYVIENIIKI